MLRIDVPARTQVLVQFVNLQRLCHLRPSAITAKPNYEAAGMKKEHMRSPPAREERTGKSRDKCGLLLQ
jgi:hypothetical protein